MTTVVVPAEPPIAGQRLPALQDVFSPDRAAALYAAMLGDVCQAVQHGEADLLVNYPPAESVPEGVDPEDALREVVSPAVADPNAVRYEVQVGSNRAAHVGNAVTHLLESEGEATVGVLEPTAPFLGRQHLGSAAMKLRSNGAVVGPSTNGRVYFAAFREPIDFTDVYQPPATETVTARAVEAGLDVDFLPLLPRVETEADLATAVPLLGAREQADRIVPARTADFFEGVDPETWEAGSSDRP